MYSFQAKIGLKKLKKGKNKNYRSIPLLNDAKLKIPKKIAIKLKKLKYTIMASFQAKIGWKMPRKRRNKNYRSVPFRSVPTRRVIENSQKTGKIFKKLKNTFMASFLAKIGFKRPRKRENNNYRSVPFPPDAKQKIPKKQQRNSKS